LVLDPDGVLVAANDLARRAFGLTASDLGRPLERSSRRSRARSSWPSSSIPRGDPGTSTFRSCGARRRTGSGSSTCGSPR
jgi:PAS domain-containing protein